MMAINETEKSAEKLFEIFIEKCILNNDSFLTDETDIIKLDTINDCIKRFIIDKITESGSFEDKVKKQFKDASNDILLTFAHVNWLWCMALYDMKNDTKKKNIEEILGKEKSPLIKKDIIPEVVIGSAGLSIKIRKHKEISFLLLLMKDLKSEKKDNPENIKKRIIDICLELKYNEENKDKRVLISDMWDSFYGEKLAMFNILLHLCNPNEYEPIISEGHKTKIRNTFQFFIDEDDLNPEQQIKVIRGKITDITKKEGFSFYDDDIKKMWNYSSSNKDFSEVQGLLYKKAIILFGPPGTGKTYTAKRIARELITKEYLQNQENFIAYLENKEVFTKERIHILQLHSNYNYEDFVAGIQLVNHKTRVKKGKLFDICKRIEIDKEKGLPHVLILDEMNRIDLSRLFGELFSALEYRDEPIDLSIGNLKLNIPSNLYIIGTMNEIDFSLERIDFALRRRFLWFFYGFEKDTLRDMINNKNESLDKKLGDEDIERFIENAQLLNQEIERLPELGKQYQIGHTFFAEVVEIYKRYKEINNISNKGKNKLFKEGGAVNILWDISIEPMLSAFLGNMDKESKTNKLRELKDKFFNNDK